MVSKMVVERQKLSQDVSTWVGAHAPLLSTTLSQLLGAGGITEATFHTLARAIERALERLVAADDAHATELSDDAKPRAERDAAAEVVGSELQFARSTIQPVYGELGLKAAGLASPILRDPVALSRQGHQFITMATADGFAMPAPRKAAVKVDVASLVNDVTPGSPPPRRSPQEGQPGRGRGAEHAGGEEPGVRRVRDDVPGGSGCAV
jgi:hypothetical protein